MRSATRLVIIALLGLFLALPVASFAGSFSGPSASASAESVDRLVAQPTQPTVPSSPGATAPSGPKLQPDTEADRLETRRKLIMGVTSIVLIALVVWGRSVRRKRRKALEGK
jgi:hypothetical protein